jgi:putative SOS response-associated peptidase YedK
MCNDYRLLTASTTLFDGFSEIKIPIRFSEGKPNLEAREDIKITDMAPPMVRMVEGEPGVFGKNADGRTASRARKGMTRTPSRPPMIRAA